MCRNIRRLYKVDPPATDREVRDAASQFVRKVSGYRQPWRANEAAFECAVEAVAGAVHELMDSLVTSAPPRDRAADAARAQIRAAKRYEA